MERFADLEVAPRFWELIEAARRDKAKLRGLLRGVSRDDLIRFEVEFDYMIDDLVSQATDQEGDTDHEEDVAGWVVSQGLRRYARVYDRKEKFPAEAPDWDSNLRGMRSSCSRNGSGSRCRGGVPSRGSRQPRAAICSAEAWPSP